MTILRMNRQRPWTIRLLAGTAIAFVAVISAAGAADAHAALVSSTPAPGSVLVDSPKTIELKFSEPVEMPQQAIRVFDANRNEIDVPTARHGASNDTVTTTLPALEEGGYVISWRVVSADGHPISAAYTFAVGQGSVGADVADAVARLKPHGASRTSGVLYGVARAIAYAALATAGKVPSAAIRSWRFGRIVATRSWCSATTTSLTSVLAPTAAWKRTCVHRLWS